MKRIRLGVFGLVAGSAWGAAAYLLGARAFGTAIWSGIAASPFIGVLMALVVHPRFADSTGYRRTLWAFVSLYGGSILFGLAIGIVTELQRFGPGHVPFSAIWENVIAMLWGVTVTGFFIVLAPLAYATHWMLEQAD